MNEDQSYVPDFVITLLMQLYKENKALKAKIATQEAIVAQFCMDWKDEQ